MVQTTTKSIATAFFDGDDTWRWHLKIDPVGLYRWYLDDDGPTELRGTTRQQADHVLRRFVERSIRGELRILSGTGERPTLP